MLQDNMKDIKEVQEIILRQATSLGIDPRALAEKLLNKSVDRPKSSYYACGGCRREFFSEEDFLNHPCKKDAGNLDPKGLMRGMSTHGDRPLTMGKGSGDSGNGDSRGNKQYGLVTGDLGNLNDGSVEAELANIDTRLAATTEVVDMKEKLAEAGVECHTLNKEQTELLFKSHFGLTDSADGAGDDDDNAGDGGGEKAKASSAKPKTASKSGRRGRSVK